ncbi:MAG: PCMD domain-containing protein [Bacteroidales bacterium]|jgi:hypothetical protein|nr:PCMD domain-containing protein [Bacteroidales bacterium]
MKNFYKIFFISFISSLFLYACIQDEPLNIEADILECTVPDLPTSVQYGTTTIKPSKGNNRISIWISSDYKVGILSPKFVLTQGATISPASGTPLDFSNEQEQKYIVTSENGQWKREYTVVVRPRFALVADENSDGKSKTFHFENHQKFDGNYNFHQFYEESLSGKKDFIWDSGNLGFALTNANAPAENYPTFSTSDGKTGSAVQLVTRSTGAFGAMVGMPIAAGNLFLGNFDLSQALSAPLQATHFGVPYMMGEPLEIGFYYKFQGGTFIDKNGVEQQDFPSIYAVLFEPEIVNDEVILLNGENVLTASNVVSAAELAPSQIIHSDNIATAEFSYGSIQFVPRKEIDAQKLANADYYIAIVFASSHRGQYFEGFVGNTLIIDEVQLITK